MKSQEKIVLPPPRIVPVTDWHQEADRLGDNLRRMGCYIILYSYEELKRWLRPVNEYSPNQVKKWRRRHEHHPLEEVYAFFFEPNGVDAVIEAFDVRLSVDQVRKVAKDMFTQADQFMRGVTPTDTVSPAAWEMLASILMVHEAESLHGSTR
jgi:hypothetical protein